MDTESGQFRTLFFDIAPEGAYSEEFKTYAQSVWPEDEQVPTIGTMLLITKFLLTTTEPHLSEQAGHILTGLVNMAIGIALIQLHGLDSEIRPEMVDDMLNAELAQYGMTLGADGELELITIH